MNIEQQLQWETDMRTLGIERFRRMDAKAVETRAHETSAGSMLLKNLLSPIAEHMDLYIRGELPNRRRKPYVKLLETLDTHKIAMFTMQSLIHAVMVSADKPVSMTAVSVKIGMKCEDELRFIKFHLEKPAYYESLIADFARKNTVNYDHKRRVLNAKSEDEGVEWSPWGNETRANIGALAIALALEVTDIVEIRKSTVNRRTSVFLRASAECQEWIARHNEFAELARPDKMPTILPPVEWTNAFDGGFYSKEMQTRTPLIKGSETRQGRAVRAAQADMPRVLKAVNAMQNTAWQINTDILRVMRQVWTQNLEIGMPRAEPIEMPASPVPEGYTEENMSMEQREQFHQWKAVMRELYTLESNRVAKSFSVARILGTATKMEQFDEFYYVYQADFRGRLYCTVSGLSPQGDDRGKALLRFARGKALGSADGVRWFKINGANKFGFDKGTYDERVQWADEHAYQIIASANDPLSNRWWAEADKPYQFLAWCFEYAAFVAGGSSASFVSHLPVGLDGSCNGLQHYSAMLRDSVGGAAVNLTPSDKPADIYQDVADVCTKKLQALAAGGDAKAMTWLSVLPDNIVPRKLSKKPVMTLPYGAKEQSCTTSIVQWAAENVEFPKGEEFAYALYLKPLLWDSIGEVVIAAREAMDWIIECTRILAKANKPLDYVSPIGFPVYQAAMKQVSKEVVTQIGGRMKLRMNVPTDKIDVVRQKNGSSPNFVHHVDATHMMMTVTDCVDAGIEDFAMIHDDYGTHAADAQQLQEIIQTAFVVLHTEYDLLGYFKEVHETDGIELPPVPAYGDLNLNDVLFSSYFFG